MPLTLSVMHKGEPAECWAILENRSDYAEDTTRVVLGLFRNEGCFLQNPVANCLERRTYSFSGVGYTLEELYAKLQQPVPVIMSYGEDEIAEIRDENGNLIRAYRPAVPATYKESNPFAVNFDPEEVQAANIALAIDKLWHFVDAFGEQQFDRNYRERCLAWLADPASSAARKARIAELWTWGDTFWAEFYRVKALILAGDLEAKYNTANIAACPYNIAEIAEV